MTENEKYCSRIADELEMYYNGEIYRCENCESTFQLKDDEDNPCCADYGFEQLSLYDYFDDVLDIEYTIGSDLDYRGVRLMITAGGPNVFIDTVTKQVELYWWTEQASISIDPDICDEIDSIFAECYDMARVL